MIPCRNEGSSSVFNFLLVQKKEVKFKNFHGNRPFYSAFVIASLHLYCMYGYTVTVYYTCTVISRTDPKSGTVFFSFLFRSSTHHCRYYCLFLAVNYIEYSSLSFQPAPFRPPSSFTALVLSPLVHTDHRRLKEYS